MPSTGEQNATETSQSSSAGAPSSLAPKSKMEQIESNGKMPGESTIDYYKRLGFRELPPSGKGFIMPTGRRSTSGEALVKDAPENQPKLSNAAKEITAIIETNTTTLIYADWEGDPVLLAKNAQGYTQAAYIHFPHRAGWEPMNVADAVFKAKLLRKDQFERMFPEAVAELKKRPERG